MNVFCREQWFIGSPELDFWLVGGLLGGGMLQ